MIIYKGRVAIGPPFFKTKKEMITFKYIKKAGGVPKGTIKVWKDNHAGLVRQLVNEGAVEVISDNKEKVDKLLAKKPEKIQSKTAPKKPAKKK